MLNISKKPLHKDVDLNDYKSFKNIFKKTYYKYFNRFLAGFAIAILVILFLPWTQNISGSGLITTLTPDQRPQTIQSQIPGRIEQWFVREGAKIQKGDTILRISEVKSEYFDNKLIERTYAQINAKEMAVSAYENKVNALDRQIRALQEERNLKLKQAQNKLLQSKLKVQSDSIRFEVTKINNRVAKTQFIRNKTLQKEGLKPVKDVEQKRLKLQETEANLIEQENKLLAARNEVINAKVEISSLKASYLDKISKVQSDKYSAKSSQLNSEVELSKLKNKNSNFEIRNSLLYITAPQNGYVNKTLKAGIGETFKEGEGLVSIMPADIDLAVETFVRPIDLPLIHKGEKVRVEFDGWPAVVFSGWPNLSYGTYGAKVVAIGRFISNNGKYRILLSPDEEDHNWPSQLRAGSGARTIALLEDVPIWFEIWRQLNSFPPNYYQPDNVKKEKIISQYK